MVVSRQYRRGFRVTACAVNYDLCVERTPIYHTVRTKFPHVLRHLSSTAVSVALLVSIQHIYIYKILNWRYSIAAFFYISPWILHELYRIPVSLFRFSSFTDSDVKRTNNNKKKNTTCSTCWCWAGSLQWPVSKPVNPVHRLNACIVVLMRALSSKWSQTSAFFLFL